MKRREFLKITGAVMISFTPAISALSSFVGTKENPVSSYIAKDPWYLQFDKGIYMFIDTDKNKRFTVIYNKHTEIKLTDFLKENGFDRIPPRLFAEKIG